MRLQLVTGTTFRTVCEACLTTCGKGMTDARIWADLDSKAFQAYYCPDCVKGLEDHGYRIDKPVKWE